MTKAVELIPDEAVIVESGVHKWKMVARDFWKSPDGKRSRNLQDWMACGGAGWMEQAE